ncbi:MAG: T9SS type A sorting domain-containing protein [Chitinophagaceae bacterium]|nr:T9SS type A sorting domain-containing protein [Chitinophagaceae bacterium]
MKYLYLICIFFNSIVGYTQNPSIIKAFPSGTIEYPSGLSQKQWQNNKWNNLCFYQCSGSNPSRLAITDGTTAGTKYIADIGNGNVQYTFAAQDFMYLIMSNGDIYKSDGTTSGTQLVAAAVVSYGWSTGIYNHSVLGNSLFFGGYDPVHGIEIWKTDGTTAGTVMIKDINPGTAHSTPGAFCRVGNDVLFRADAPGQPSKLWKTDGTEAGTVQIPVAEPFNFVNWDGVTINNKMIFFGSGVNNFEPYVSDGTAAGTFMLKDINPSGRSLPTAAKGLHFKKNSKYVFFIANDGTTHGLWRTDGSIAGTIKLNDYSNDISDPIYSDVDESGIWYFTNTSGVETIVKSNGTVSGSFVGPSNISYGQNMKIYKNACFFAARDFGSPANIEPWRSDITIANTQKAFEIAPPQSFGNYSSEPKGFFELNNKLYFFAKDFVPFVGQTLNLYQYDGNFTFTGGVAGNRWRDSANWLSAMPPGISDTVFINAATPNINTQKAYAGVLKLANNANINFTNATDSLILNTKLEVGTNSNFTGNGILSFKNIGTDTVQIANGFTANNMAVQSNTNLANGTVVINNNINLTSGKLFLNNNNIQLIGNTSTVTTTSNAYVATNGTGSLQIQNIGSGARIGAVNFPIGTAANYAPVTFTNSGDADNFNVRVTNTISQNYTGESPAGQQYVTGAVNNTWFINEGTSGGSNATIELQWDAAQELSLFDRTQSYLGHYTGGAWNLGTQGTATGSNPYNFSRSNITSFSPFGILNNNAVLPLKFISFSLQKCNNNQVCLNWKTANEQNVSHFEIERSVDGISFAKIGTKAAHNLAQNTYTATDDISTIQTKQLYYRIIQVDINGKTTNSTVQLIKLQSSEQITIYPNPVVDEINMLNWNKVQQVQLVDVTGKMVKQWQAITSSLLPVKEITAGVYFIKIKLISGEMVTQKIIKQ